MSFGSLQRAHEFYVNYAKKVGFVTKVDKMNKELKVPINQLIHCNRRAATQANKIIAKMQSKDVCDVRQGKGKMDGVKVRTEAFPPLELTVHTKCVIEDNDETSIRPNKTYLALAKNEEIPSFEYWVKYMGTAPQGIITDQCKVIFGEIKKVLPNTHHRWCI
ncbi:hypothetical protein Ahy_B04g072991 isoform B [Arachis hypogaea]|uniref:Protein FAR1-RELATED SEQUENCE n=1 Tax=Arachis hypogaea TaxID=3818 RepID=A0A444ZPA7_ARAHY|nr:hypothetical protein Ahy_B04g072991 isoform B [Arachis hypogaea]